MANIVAVVSSNRDVAGGGAPIFFADNEQELEQTAFLLEKILNANAHNLKNGVIILVNHL
ncbi:hypothetical protein ABEW34_07060 [Paenibacillus algorifonticola]|uniref:Uncharacterized protein n=1 Tax=Paenibacillus sp. BIHB 4019 TaxID=1870819 RepID=A0A1B2DMA4_9BACL|nr:MULTISPECIES: hypothetical protein [unclassified Paenibacillus]ANY68843.1 hypothetical protein BBD42_21980 [Paenibacillus sp. BIHB 4019]KQO17422.1 hypothetical protein ASF12_01660 [Paenibacillus sp. Leaf72]